LQVDLLSSHNENSFQGLSTNSFCDLSQKTATVGKIRLPEEQHIQL